MRPRYRRAFLSLSAALFSSVLLAGTGRTAGCGYFSGPRSGSLRHYLLDRHQENLRYARERWKAISRALEGVVEREQDVGTRWAFTTLQMYRATRALEKQEAELAAQQREVYRRYGGRVPRRMLGPEDGRRLEAIERERYELLLRYQATIDRLRETGFRGPARELEELGEQQAAVLVLYRESRRCLGELRGMSEEEVRRAYDPSLRPYPFLDVTVGEETVYLEAGGSHEVVVRIGGGSPPFDMTISSPLGVRRQRVARRGQLRLPFVFPSPGNYPVSILLKDSSQPPRLANASVVFMVSAGPAPRVRRSDREDAPASEETRATGAGGRREPPTRRPESSAGEGGRIVLFGYELSQGDAEDRSLPAVLDPGHVTIVVRDASGHASILGGARAIEVLREHGFLEPGSLELTDKGRRGLDGPRVHAGANHSGSDGQGGSGSRAAVARGTGQAASTGPDDLSEADRERRHRLALIEAHRHRRGRSRSTHYHSLEAQRRRAAAEARRREAERLARQRVAAEERARARDGSAPPRRQPRRGAGALATSAGPRRSWVVYVDEEEGLCCVHDHWQRYPFKKDGERPLPLHIYREDWDRGRRARILRAGFSSRKEATSWVCSHRIVPGGHWNSNYARIEGVLVGNTPCEVNDPTPPWR